MTISVMVSQSQDHEWANSPSRTGSMLSLDGRQRPATAKTPPSYYDAVRSRHSLSQPVNKSPESLKQDKVLHVQQVKYNSLPRPLPQRYPPAVTNPQHPRNTWTEESLNNGNVVNQCGVRQQYDAPPKPANRVPLQLQVHQERSPAKRVPGEQPESYHQRYVPAPRGLEHLRMNNVPRQGVERIDGSTRTNGIEMSRKEPALSMPMRVDGRPPPPIPGRRPPQARIPNGIDSPHNSLKREVPQNAGPLRRFPIPVHGSQTIPNGFSPASRTVVDGVVSYEPRFSKSGKLCQRAPTHEPRPMPPPVVMLRTGPLGTYPETLKRSEMASYNHRQERSYSTGDFDQYQRVPVDGNVSQKGFMDPKSYPNGTSDHSNSSYRRPPVSPHDTRSPFDENQSRDRKNTRNETGNHLQQSLSLTHLQNSSPSHVPTNFKSQTLPTNGRIPTDCFNPIRDYINRNQQQTNLLMQHRNENASSVNSNFGKTGSLSHDSRNYTNPDVNGAIYANHEISPHAVNGNRVEPSFDFQRSRSNSSCGPLYENSPSLHASPREGFRGIQESFPESVYANYNVDVHYSNGHPASNFKPPDCQQKTTIMENGHPVSMKNSIREQQNEKQKQHPPPVAQKPANPLPQPSEMIDARGWNGQAHINSYSKDVVKPTPRLPRFANGLIASSAQLTTVPAYQCVINELTTRPPPETTSPTATDSSTLSFRSGCDSSSSSSREFSRRPCKSDSSMEQLRSLEGGVRSANGYRQIDKSLLSASMTSLCSEASSSLSMTRRRLHHEDSSQERINDELQKRKEKGSVFSASPWEREAKEKLQKEQVLDARRARDQEISYLESIVERSDKQEEWLRILRLEREFQRRAEQELDDDEDEGSVCSESTDSDKPENFHGDKLTVIPNERMGLKLLDELLDTSSKNTTPSEKSSNKRELSLGNPSEKHFIPLDVAIPDNDFQPSSLPMTNNILKISSDQIPEDIGGRLSKPPVPAPRPSKNFTPVPSADSQEIGFESLPATFGNENISSSLAKLEISDCAYFCSTENDVDSSLSDQQNHWLIEVPNDISHNRAESSTVQQKSKQNGADNRNSMEHSRIYENIKPADYQCLKTQLHSSANGFSSHTLPKSTNSNYSLSSTKETVPIRSVSRYSDRKFPTMGVSSTLTKKANGFVPSDADILPSLYASCKTRTEVVKEVPADLVDKSPEFKKMWISRPEKLTFQDKIRKFQIQAGDEDLPRDRIKNSKAQREIETKFSDAHKRAAASQKAAES